MTSGRKVYGAASQISQKRIRFANVFPVVVFLFNFTQKYAALEQIIILICDYLKEVYL